MQPPKLGEGIEEVIFLRGQSIIIRKTINAPVTYLEISLGAPIAHCTLQIKSESSGGADRNGESGYLTH